jgi:hypothetical protein
MSAVVLMILGSSFVAAAGVALWIALLATKLPLPRLPAERAQLAYHFTRWREPESAPKP